MTTLNFELPTPGGSDDVWGGMLNDAFSTLDGLVVNVKATPYGASGNGTDDDTTPIVDAIAAVSTAGGGVVWFPTGAYKITAMIVVPSNVWLRGAGANSIIRLGANGLYGVVSLDNATSRNGILDLAIDGQKAAHTGTGFGVVIGSDDSVVQRVRVFDTINNGVEVGGADRVRVLDCDFDGSNSNAIRFANSSHDGLIRGNNVRNCKYGIFGYGGSDGSTSCDRLKIVENRVSDITGTDYEFAQDGGIAVTACTEPEVRGNTVKDSAGRGIHVFGYSPGADVSHNRVKDCGLESGTAGIDLGDVGDFDYTVKGNRTRGNGGAGIVTAPLQYSVLEGNVCANNAQSGEYPETAAGIALIGVVTPEIKHIGNVVNNNVCYDDQGTKTQNYGILEVVSDASVTSAYHLDSVYVGNMLKGNNVAGIALQSVTSTSANNETT